MTHAACPVRLCGARLENGRKIFSVDLIVRHALARRGRRDRSPHFAGRSVHQSRAIDFCSRRHCLALSPLKSGQRRLQDIIAER